MIVFSCYTIVPSTLLGGRKEISARAGTRYTHGDADTGYTHGLGLPQGDALEPLPWNNSFPNKLSISSSFSHLLIVNSKVDQSKLVQVVENEDMLEKTNYGPTGSTLGGTS